MPPLHEYELETQFRCGGSEAFIGWVENTLGIARTPYTLWETDEDFEFDVVDSPRELQALINQKAAAGNSARLVAGFCWPWSNPDSDGTLVDDVRIERLVDAVERQARGLRPGRRDPQVALLGIRPRTGSTRWAASTPPRASSSTTSAWSSAGTWCTGHVTAGWGSRSSARTRWCAGPPRSPPRPSPTW